MTLKLVKIEDLPISPAVRKLQDDLKELTRLHEELKQAIDELERIFNEH